MTVSRWIVAGVAVVCLASAVDALAQAQVRYVRYEAGGRPMVLAENDRWLRKLATGRLRDPVAFWARMQALPTA